MTLPMAASLRSTGKLRLPSAASDVSRLGRGLHRRARQQRHYDQMVGKGAGHDNVFVERLWRSVKYEEVYLRAYDSVSDARASLGRYLVTAADHIRALTA